MKRRIPVMIAACVLITAALLAGCGEEDSAASQPTVTENTQQETPTEKDTQPTEVPTEETTQPTEAPTEDAAQPTEVPTEETTQPTEAPTEDAAQPTEVPTEETTQPTEAPTEEATQPTEAPTEETTQPQQLEPTPVDEQTCEVETIYGSLYFRTDWSEYMQIQQLQQDDTLKVSFLARVNEKDYPLFDLLIHKDQGEAPFVLTDSQGNPHGVDVRVEQQLEHEELDENGQRILYAMQEEINFVLENLK